MITSISNYLVNLIVDNNPVPLHEDKFESGRSCEYSTVKAILRLVNPQNTVLEGLRTVTIEAVEPQRNFSTLYNPKEALLQKLRQEKEEHKGSLLDESKPSVIPDVISVPEVSKRLGISEKKVREICERMYYINPISRMVGGRWIVFVEKLYIIQREIEQENEKYHGER